MSEQAVLESPVVSAEATTVIAVKPKQTRKRGKSPRPDMFRLTKGRPKQLGEKPMNVLEGDEDDGSYFPEAVYVEVAQKSRTFDMVDPIGNTKNSDVSKPAAKGIWLTLRRPRRTQLNGIIDDEVTTLLLHFPFMSHHTEFVTVHRFAKKEVVRALCRARDGGANIILTEVPASQLEEEKRNRNMPKMTGAYNDPRANYNDAGVRDGLRGIAPTMPIGTTRPASYAV
jgi:hypothetical protein